MRKRLGALFLTGAVLLSCTVSACAASAGAGSVVSIVLSDSGVEVDGTAASTDPSAAVYTGADIIYYEDGTDSSYGEGTDSEKHSAEEAAAHTVVTITQPGTYRLSGTLSQGQIFVDLGEGAQDDPTAVVTLVLDSADVTCTVAPAIFFYRVYECGIADTASASPDVDTTAAGANVILAAGSENNISGSHIARIYEPGTTEKLHKYDGAFYSRMSMNIYGDGEDDSGVLNITGDNEGLNSELHLTVWGGTINISAQDDGINTNEDFVSVTTLNGGKLTVNGGLGAEGDGIDSNGYLTINGGEVWAMSNESSPDGGIDADSAITINGGTVYAFGTRNDAVDSGSDQLYMELSFASTLPAGSVVSLEEPEGDVPISVTTQKTCQSITFSSPDLTENTAYAVYVDGIQQQYTGNRTGMAGGPGGMGGGRPDGEPPVGFDPDADPGARPDGEAPDQGDRPQRPEDLPDGATPPEGMTPPEDGQNSRPGVDPGSDMTGTDAEASTEFTLTSEIRSFSGVSDSPDSAGKTRVSFTVNNGRGIDSVVSGSAVTVEQIQASVTDLPDSDVQITITDVPSEDYAQSCLLSDGAEALAAILPTDDGTYCLTIAVVSTNADYAGASQWQFTIGVLPFRDVREDSTYYDAVKYVYDAGLMTGTSTDTFSPDATVTRAQAVTVLARMAQAAAEETSQFSDVAAGSWYSGYVGWAAENGIVQGDGTGRFLPDDPVTGEQMELMLSRYAQLMGEDYTASGGSTTALSRADLAEIVAAFLQESPVSLSPACCHSTPSGLVTAGRFSLLWKKMKKT